MADNEQTAREDPSVSADDLAALKRRAETAEANAANATNAANQLLQQRDQAAHRAYSEISRRVQSDETAIANAIAAAAAEGESAERELAEALASNDAMQIAKAQRKLTRADMSLAEAETQNRNLQNWKHRQAQQAAQQEEQARQQQEYERQQPQQPQAPPGEISLARYTPATREWLRQHPDLLKDTPDANAARKLVVADHFVAEARGLVADTPSYFEFLEGGYQGRRLDGGSPSPYSQAAQTVEVDLQSDSGVRITRNEQQPRPAGAREAEASRQASQALPPSRSSSPANGNRNGGRVSLTVGEQDAARASWPHLPPAEAYREYAINKVELQKEGRL
jgi:hypothetical protein